MGIDDIDSYICKYSILIIIGDQFDVCFLLAVRYYPCARQARLHVCCVMTC